MLVFKNIYFFYPLYYFLMNLVTLFINIFIRRDKNIIIFGAWSGKRFAGNSRFLFQYLSLNKEKYCFTHVIWITKSKIVYNELKKLNYEVYMENSLKSICYHFKAGYFAMSAGHRDFKSVLCMGSYRYYLSHNPASVKKSSFSKFDELNLKDKVIVYIYKLLNSFYFFRHFFIYPGGWDKKTQLVASNRDIERLKSKIDVNEYLSTSYIISGFPELCECLAYTESELKFLNDIHNHKKVILYAPTYRFGENIEYKNPLDNVSFCKYLQENDCFWIEKLHPVVKKGTMKAKKYNSSYSLELPLEFDLNILLRNIDLLITDYSSIYAKAIYFEKPFLLYLPDNDNYIKNDYGFSEEYEKLMREFGSTDMDSFIKNINESFTDKYFINHKKTFDTLRKNIFESIPSYQSITKDLFGRG